MDQKLTIEIPEGEDAIVVVEQVLKLLEEGYTAGSDPTWDLKRVDL
jgi:hypothetical protein